MGIETVAIIAGLATSLAGAGAEVAASRDQAREGKDARRDQAYQLSRRQAQLDEAQKANDATDAARQARMRQRALLAGAGGNPSTIATSPLGLAPTAGGPQPLKTLGA